MFAEMLWEAFLEFFEAIRRRDTTNNAFLPRVVCAERRRLLMRVPAATASSNSEGEPWRFVLVDDGRLTGKVARIGGESARRPIEEGTFGNYPEPVFAGKREGMI